MARIVKNLEQDQGASTASPPTGLSPTVEPASGLDGFATSIPSASHTPLPWRIRENPRNSPDECDLSICGDIFVLADINGPQYEHQAANAAFIVRACNSHYELLEALLQINGEAPARETRDGPSVGFPPSRDPEIDDGNEVVREAFDEGVCRGLAIAAGIARAAITKATGA